MNSVSEAITAYKQKSKLPLFRSPMHLLYNRTADPIALLVLGMAVISASIDKAVKVDGCLAPRPLPVLMYIWSVTNNRHVETNTTICFYLYIFSSSNQI
jgi:hypothetical protein